MKPMNMWWRRVLVAVLASVMMGSLSPSNMVVGLTSRTVLRPVDTAAFDEATGALFVAFMGAGSQPFVRDMRRKAPVQIGKVEYSKRHLYPTILKTADGRLHVFYGADETPLRYSVSAGPLSAEAWEKRNGAIGASAASATYPSAAQTESGAIYVFFRDTTELKKVYPNLYRPWAMIKSSDGGLTWSPMVRIIDLLGRADGMTEVYSGGAKYRDGKFHIAWTRSGGRQHAERHENLYYAYLDPASDHMFSASGQDLGETIDDAEAESWCLVFNVTGHNRAPMTHSAVVESIGGQPIVAFKSFRQVVVARRVGGAWETKVLGRSYDPLWGIDIDLRSDGTLAVYSTGEQTAKAWFSHDGGSSWGPQKPIMLSDTPKALSAVPGTSKVVVYSDVQEGFLGDVWLVNWPS